MAANRKVPKHVNDTRRIHEGGGESDPEERVQVLPTRRGNLATPEEAESHTTPGGDAERGSNGVDVGNMGPHSLSRGTGGWECTVTCTTS